MPADVRSLSSWEYLSMLKLMDDDRREQERIARKRR